MTDRTEELRQGFAECDTNNDGKIQLEEFEELLKNLHAETTAEETRLGFEELDTDKDGVISFEEFLGWWSEG